VGRQTAHNWTHWSFRLLHRSGSISWGLGPAAWHAPPTGGSTELVVRDASSLPAAGGGLSLLSGYQAVNLTVAAPLTWLGGGGATSRPIPFVGALSLPFNAPAMPGTTLSAQMYVVDPANPDGIALSRVVQLSIAP
jgi:hypothetical protein